MFQAFIICKNRYFNVICYFVSKQSCISFLHILSLIEIFVALKDDFFKKNLVGLGLFGVKYAYFRQMTIAVCPLNQ